MDTSNPNKGSVTTTRLFSSTLGTQTPNSVLGAAKLVCQTPLFFATTLVMPDFWMVTTLCDGLDTPRMVATPVEDSQ
jgi:hypothetical protein